MSCARSSYLVKLLPFLVAVSLTMSANALPPAPGGKGISVMTLHMQRMTTLETALHKAVNERDTISLSKLLSSFFEIRRAGGIIVDRDTWLREGVKSDGELHQLSAYEVGNSVIANFTLVSAGQSNRFVVDVWTLEQDEWRLRVRFETAQPRNQSKLPPPDMPNNK
jgi:hypothetical protein